MKKQYWFIIITYAVMQFSGFIAVPILFATGLYGDDMFTPSIHWTVFSFAAALLVTIFLLKEDIQNRHLVENRVSTVATVFWGIAGFVLALVGQGIANAIQMLFQPLEQSANTAAILELSRQAPVFIVVVAILGPILEEIVFRYVLFDVFYKKFNFFVGALVSSLIFAVIHFDFTHLLVYIVMGFVFSFLYVQTKRIIVPIIAHMLMNTFVVAINLLVPLDYWEQVVGFFTSFL